jgi:hypothetical protein
MENSHTWNILGGISYLCHLNLGVNSNTYCNRKYCTFTVISSLIFVLLPTGAQGLLVHPVPCYVTRLYSSVAESITHSTCVSGQKWIIIAPWKQSQHAFYVTLLCCVLRNQLIALLIFKNLLTGDISLQFLCKEVPRIWRRNFTSKTGPLLQNRVAPRCISPRTKSFFDNRSSDRPIGRSSPTRLAT